MIHYKASHDGLFDGLRSSSIAMNTGKENSKLLLLILRVDFK